MRYQKLSFLTSNPFLRHLHRCTTQSKKRYGISKIPDISSVGQGWKICNPGAIGGVWLIFKALLQLFSSEFWQQDLKKKEKYVKKKAGVHPSALASPITHTPLKNLLQFSKENGLLTLAIGIKDTLMEFFPYFITSPSHP